jgi:putative molybdopterin biosynthesis protein
MKQNIYLETIPLDSALKIWENMLSSINALNPCGAETILVEQAVGRVSAEPVSAKLSSPHYHSSAMDGYAVRFAETFGASETAPKRLKIGQDAVYCDTGDPMPDGFNAVIMVEDVNLSGDFIEIIEPVTPWQHVRVVGEDIVATELIIPENHIVRPIDASAMLSAGITHIAARKRPKIIVIPTGSELVAAGAGLKKGQIIESNSAMLCGMAAECGAEASKAAIIKDDIYLLKEALLKAVLEADIVLINAGSSAGSEDFTSTVIKELGEVFIHGVNIKPGKPVVLGAINNKPVIGVPGYAVSAYLIFKLFVKPVIYKKLGLIEPPPEFIEAKISRQVSSPLATEEFLRVKLGSIGGNVIATPASKGAGVLMSLVRADGIVRIPAESEGIAAGSMITVELMRSKADIQNTIICIGSHDNALDILANHMKKSFPEISLASSHVGSMGGLIALKRGETHISGTHLLDEETGQYNVDYIRKLLPDKKIVLINLMYRQQGLLVLKGNPKKITDFSDLLRDDVSFVNRQRGSGTRLLTDKCLKDMNLLPEFIKGYEREEYTHMGVASAVLTGMADTGLAVLSSAIALGLDFIPVAKERYDIAIDGQFYETDLIQKLLHIIREDMDFRQAVISLGGYDCSEMGKIIMENNL